MQAIAEKVRARARFDRQNASRRARGRCRARSSLRAASAHKRSLLPLNRTLPTPPPQKKQARQTLGIGGREGFEPISLERYRCTLDSAAPTASWLREYARLLDAFASDADAFVAATGRLLTDCPMPLGAQRGTSWGVRTMDGMLGEESLLKACSEALTTTSTSAGSAAAPSTPLLPAQNSSPTRTAAAALSRWRRRRPPALTASSAPRRTRECCLLLMLSGICFVPGRTVVHGVGSRRPLFATPGPASTN